jgi:hypothetical protein
VEAVSVTVSAVLTAETVAVKLAVLDPVGTVNEVGTAIALLLLAKLTAKPFVAAAAAFSVTVQPTVPTPVIEPLVHVRPLNIGIPVPVKLTVRTVPVEELLLMVSVPTAAPAAVGANCPVKVAV